MMGIVNRTILKRFSVLKKTRSKTIYEVTKYIGAHSDFGEFILGLLCNFMPYSQISTSKIAVCLTKPNYLFMMMNKNIV